MILPSCQAKCYALCKYVLPWEGVCSICLSYNQVCIAIVLYTCNSYCCICCSSPEQSAPLNRWHRRRRSGCQHPSIPYTKEKKKDEATWLERCRIMYSYIGWLVTRACREVFRYSRGIHVVSVNIHNHWLLQLHNNNMWKVCHVLFFYLLINKAGFRKCKKYRIWDGWKNESDLFPVLIKKKHKKLQIVCLWLMFTVPVVSRPCVWSLRPLLLSWRADGPSRN